MTQHRNEPRNGRGNNAQDDKHIGQQQQGKTRSGETAGDRDVTGNPAEGYQNSLAATKDMVEGEDPRGIARGD